MGLLIELLNKLMKKVYHMPIRRALPVILILIGSIFSINQVFADDLKDIAQLASQGQQAAALDRINTYISNNPKDVQALFIRGVILAEQGKREEATRAFTEITEKYPSLPEPYNNLAVLYADQGQYDKARKALETAIKTHPSYATAHENLGDIYARMASEAYDKALQLDNSNTRALGKLSLIKDLFSSTGKPILLANKSPDTGKDSTKDTAKAPNLANPIRPAEPKPLENKPAESVKPVEPAKPAETKPASNKPTEVSKPAETTEQAKSSNDENDAVDAVKGWAKAWGSKNVDKYLAAYANNFQTPNGESRSEWEQTRRERINKPKTISVEVSNLQVKMEDGNRARIKFKQSYRAGGVSMRTNKTLVLKKASGKWLIEQELTDR